MNKLKYLLIASIAFLTHKNILSMEDNLQYSNQTSHAEHEVVEARHLKDVWVHDILKDQDLDVITTLDLCGNFNIGDEAAIALANNDKLTTLDLSGTLFRGLFP